MYCANRTLGFIRLAGLKGIIEFAGIHILAILVLDSVHMWELMHQ